MCGLLFSSYPGLSKPEFMVALELMNHRGPDATGYDSFGNIQLGHKRLKILDLDNRSNQPFYSADGRYVIIYNGEIYNYKELAQKYNIQQKTSCDTELIVELYAKFGPDFLSQLNGMFAMVIYDIEKQKTFIARDRLGIKPLYIYHNNDDTIISSEIKPILKITGIYKIDEFGMRQYKKLRTFFNGRTAYEHIKMFPAASYMLDNEVKCYWKLSEEHKSQPSDLELRNLVTDAVKIRLVSDVPIGSYLSGGLDSTIVASLAQKPHTWTVGFLNSNEFEWGRLASKMIGGIHHEIFIDNDEFINISKEIINKRLEPLSVPNEILLYKMTQEVKKYNTVVLSGEGADELFFGYDRIFSWASRQEKFNILEFDKLYSYGTHEDLEVLEDALRPFMHLGKPINIVAHFFQIAHLHGLLRRLDSSTMLCSVEARGPFLDYRLVEMMAGVPFECRMENGEVKSQLKRVFKSLLPKEIINRKKVGFPVPLADIPLGGNQEDSPMDQWLMFNCNELNNVINKLVIKK